VGPDLKFEISDLEYNNEADLKFEIWRFEMNNAARFEI
jgi:hypothetical protein